jgi:hypothetical protein
MQFAGYVSQYPGAFQDERPVPETKKRREEFPD